MFTTKRELKKRIRYLEDRLRKCQNIETDGMKPCLNYHCALCENAIMPDTDLPFVLMGCKANGRACNNFQPNSVYKEFYHDRSAHAESKTDSLVDNR